MDVLQIVEVEVCEAQVLRAAPDLLEPQGAGSCWKAPFFRQMVLQKKQVSISHGVPQSAGLPACFVDVLVVYVFSLRL